MPTSVKVSISVLLASLAVALLTLSLMRPPAALPESAPQSEFSAMRAMQHLRKIAQAPHSLGTPENDAVIQYVTNELEQLGLEVTMQDTLVSRSANGGLSTRVSRVKNIIGRLAGTNSSKAVLLMAHHDSQPNTPGAADDGSGVVAILESLRAIKAEGPLKNDVIALITDAEEIGLMGARAFVEYHPLLKEIGVVLNLEARGNEGLSMSFEMNEENGWIAQEFVKAAPYPFTNSMAYEIYKIMPNDTDFSMFRDTDVAGINAACVEGFVHYHSMTDTPENIDLSLVQHHGANMLGLLRHFADLPLDETKAPNAIFFNPIGSFLVLYSAGLEKLFVGLAFLLFVAVIIVGLRKKRVNLTHLLTGTGYFLVLIVALGLGTLLLQQIILWLNPHYTQFYANHSYNVSYYFVAFTGLAVLVSSFIFGFQSKLNSLSLALGGILMLVMSMFGLMLSLPTGTFLLHCPLSVFLGVQLLLFSFNIQATEQPRLYGALQIVAVIPAITLWTQFIYLLFHTFGLTQAIAVPVLLVGFLGTLLGPMIRTIGRYQKAIPMGIGGILLLLGLIGGQLTGSPSTDQPLQVHLMYGLDADTNQAVWASPKAHRPEWIQNFIPDANRQAFDAIYPDWNWQIGQSEAKLAEVAAPELQLLTDSTTINLTKSDNLKEEKELQIAVNFSQFTNSVEFFLGNAKNITNVKLNDFEVEWSTDKEENAYINFYAPPQEGFVLSMTTTNEEQAIRVVGRTIGLPTDLFPSPKPDAIIYGPGNYSNVTLVKKSYVF
ncbi:MAG: M20/M25/M40 family metallo-hydrolase [Bacteroidota bacterium]